MRLKAVVPFPMDHEGVALRAGQIPQAVRGEVDELQFAPVRNSGLLADSLYEGVLLDAYVTAEAVHAEAEGFDAVIVDTVSDSGLDALRSRLTIPVVGPGQAGFHIAAMLGRTFSILSVWHGWDFVYHRNLRRYSMENRLASIRSLDKVPDVEQLLTDDEETIGSLVDAALAAVEEDGADVLIMGSTTMYQAIPAVVQAVDVPVINPGLWAFMLAVDLVKCGVSHSKRTYAAPLKPQDRIFDLLPSRHQTDDKPE